MSKPDEAQIVFSHPRSPEPLNVWVKPNAVQWSYGLNTANYPTYGGEVIQILSVFIDDMTITGNTRSYREMENIFRWFTNYIQRATQGTTGQGADGYDSNPVKMTYPERGWQFEIIPKALPSFKYGRDLTVPEWTMQAAVVEPQWGISDSSMKELQGAILDSQGLNSQFLKGEGIELFGKATINSSAAAAGYDTAFNFNPDDPFSGPTEAQYKKDKLRGAYGELADTYNKLIPAYLESDFSDLSADYSKPAFLNRGKGGDGENTGTKKAKDVVDGERARG